MTEQTTNKEVELIKKTLNLKQLQFVDYCLTGYTPAEAYEMAGLNTDPDANLEDDATLLRRTPRIKMYIDALQRCVAQRTIMTLEAADQRLTDMAMCDPTDIIELGTTYKDFKTGLPVKEVRLKNIDNLTEAQKAAIVSIKPVPGGVEVKMVDKLKALDMLIRRKGGFKDVQELNINGNVEVFAMVGDNGRGPKKDGD